MLDFFYKNDKCIMRNKAFYLVPSKIGDTGLYVFQTRDNGICRLNPSLAIYFGNYESSNVRTKSVRNFQLVLS